MKPITTQTISSQTKTIWTSPGMRVHVRAPPQMTPKFAEQQVLPCKSSKNWTLSSKTTNRYFLIRWRQANFCNKQDRGEDRTTATTISIWERKTRQFTAFLTIMIHRCLQVPKKRNYNRICNSIIMPWRQATVKVIILSFNGIRRIRSKIIHNNRTREKKGGVWREMSPKLSSQCRKDWLNKKDTFVRGWDKIRTSEF